MCYNLDGGIGCMDEYDGIGSVYFELALKKKILLDAIKDKSVDILLAKRKIKEIESGMQDIKTGAFFTKEPLISDDVIDIRTPYLSMGIYYICLHDQKEVIGLIDYRGYHKSNLGDVGLYINEEYQHQGYGKRALTLFSYFAYSGNIDDFRTYIYEDNLASIHLVTSLGGKLVNKGVHEGKTILIFDIATTPQVKGKEKKIGEIHSDNN